MRIITLTALALCLSAPAFAKDDCAYCAEMNKLTVNFEKVKPDALNEKTIDRQNELVDDAAELLRKPFKDVTKLSAADWKRLLPFLGLVTRYDYQNIVADEMLPLMGAGRELFFAELKKARAAGLLNAADADEILVSFGTAEAVQEQAKEAN